MNTITEREREARTYDFRFTDLLGRLQHFSVPSSTMDVDEFDQGIGFDGSSIRGFQEINESDMLIIPDKNTIINDPFNSGTVSVLCNIEDPITKEHYSKDPRFIAQKAENFLENSGIADTVNIGPEIEFFLFDNFSYSNNPNECSYSVDSHEGAWRPDGRKINYGSGYFPVTPIDSLQSIREEMVCYMEQMGITVECHHHEVASGGQCEIDMKYDSLLKMADQCMLYKYVVNMVAHKHGKHACFMPKPLFSDNGSGMHTHISLFKNGENLMAGSGYAGLSDLGLNFIGGVLKHARSLLAFTNPSTNSYKRLVPGYEAPVNIAYSMRNRSASVRIPMYHSSPNSRRMEFRCPDPMANPYLAFSALLMAGIDGIVNRIDPGQPLDKNIYDLSPSEKEGLDTACASLDESLFSLEQDHEYLLRGNVFTEDVINTWINYKRENEVRAVDMRPHPYEFELYMNG